ncbi:unnamed protein product [Rhizophagus irregularis]|uniref:Uncharacterized protein n=1 Tax=Rhizophagus irregularis TaxID=588596 RepID=A0A915ZIY8_9GLOM|nr:unnamed protein product [Rhizophagus irregularis]
MLESSFSERYRKIFTYEINHDLQVEPYCTEMSIIANKVPGVYASPCQDDRTVFDFRGINNSNVLTLGSMVTNNDNAKEIIETWLKTSFTSGWEGKQDVKVSS